MSNECNLQCVKKGKKGGGEAIEFVGPVKIVLVDQSNSAEYTRIIWYAALVGAAEMFLATVTTIAQFYALGYRKMFFLRGLHSLCGTIGIQICLFSGLLVMNSSSGAAAPVKIAHRKMEHMCVQFCAMLFGGVSAASAYMAGFEEIFTVHGILGFAAVGLVLLTGFTGFFLSECCKPKAAESERFGCCLYTHLFLGIFACIVASMCFVSGMTKDIFLNWLPVYEMYTYMVLGCAVYTTIIVYKPMIMMFTGRRDSVSEY